jgi:hypothetical protein
MPRFTVLEPMSVGDVIDRAVRLYRRNFVPLVAIAAVPTLSGYIVSLMFWYGFMSLTLPSAGRPSGGDAGGIILFAVIGYPLWMILLVATIAGLSRVVGDQIMMGEPITFRRCFAFLWRRRGDMIRLGLFAILLLLVLSFVCGFALSLIIQAVAAVVLLFHSSGLPTWVMTLSTVVCGIVAAAAFVMVLFVILSRVVFLPQVVVIEGTKAGSSLSRVGFLGKRNWNKLAAIALFAYFVRLSLFMAFSVPTGIVYLFSGVDIKELFSNQTWNTITGSFWEMAGLLSLPIWAVSLTLLYFDNRVRKEAYDLQLLAAEVEPPFSAPSIIPAPAVGYQAYAPFGYRPGAVQTSPLGLSGIIPNQPPPPSSSTSRCEQCGDALIEHARFCSNCGAKVR